jgi:hypothetical protein
MTLLPRTAIFRETNGMQTEMEKNIRTAAAVGVWMAMLALSQESAAAAAADAVREDFARYGDWREHLMASASCGSSIAPIVRASDRALMCADALHVSSDRYEAQGRTLVTDTYLFEEATYTVYGGTIVAVFR